MNKPEEKVSTPDNLLIRKLQQEKQKKHNAILGDKILNDTKQLLLETEDKDLYVLGQLGLDHFQQYERKLNADVTRTKLAEDLYNKPSFMGKEIKALCVKYDLKLLRTKYYNGGIPSDLVRIIGQFSAKHKDVTMSKFFILAPTEMFNTVKHVPIQRDPILFYCPSYDSNRYDSDAHENEEFVAIHNWGNDFTFMRRFRFMVNRYCRMSDSVSNWMKTIIASAATLVCLLITLIPGARLELSISLTVISILTWIFIVRDNLRVRDKVTSQLWNDKKI